MEKNLVLDFKPHDDFSDALSTDAVSFAQISLEEQDSSPSHTHSPDSDVLDKSKRIRKKRNAYHKIDDEIRLGLLEAVQRGETLKSAAKRYQVNYSSAKSIFHIFRKEGRILKKATQEKTLEGSSVPLGQEAEIPPQFTQNYNVNPMAALFQKSNFSQAPQACQPLDFRHERPYCAMDEGVGSSSPLGGLVDSFSELLKVGGNMKPKEDIMKANNYVPTYPSRFNPKMGPFVENSMPRSQPNPQVCFVPKMNPNSVRSPAERNKHLDGFYMNYSNSPLSGNAKMIREGSGSGSNKYLQGEFDSFTDMLSAFQTQNPRAGNIGNMKDASIPKLMVPGNGEAKGSFEEEIWGGSLENAAIDTYKSFLDAQKVLSNAFRKASILNNLVQIQQKSGSPRFVSFHGS